VLPIVPSYVGFVTGLTLDEMKDGGPGEARRQAAIHSALFVLGRFNRSSQHPPRGSCDEYSEAGVSANWARRTAVTGPAFGCTTRASEGILGGDRSWKIQRGVGGVRWSVAGGRGTLVPKRGRYATFSACTVSEVGLRTVFVLRGA
jgi:hypothetical protein